MWYYEKSGKPAGPVSLDHMKRLVSSGDVTNRTKVWKEGMEEWQEAQSTQLLNLFTHSSPPPLQKESMPPPLALSKTSLSDAVEPLEGFKDPANLTNWLKIFLYLTIIISVIALFSDFLEFQLINAFKQAVYTSQARAVADAEASAARQQLIGIIQFGTFVVTGILFLKWIYRANYNARRLGASGMKFTPGWSIGWYFVPIVSLWKPYQAMKEIWKASKNPIDWQNQHGNAILPWWWFFWIVSNFVGCVSFRLSLRALIAEELNELLSACVVTLFSDVLQIALAIIAINMIRQIHEMQMAHRRATSI